MSVLHLTQGQLVVSDVIVESIAWESGLDHDQSPPLKGVGYVTEKMQFIPITPVIGISVLNYIFLAHRDGPCRAGSPSTRSNHALSNVPLLSVGPEP